MKNHKRFKNAVQLAIPGVPPNYRRIPSGAIKVVHPSIQQPDNYSCGAGSLMAVAARLGVGPERIEDFKAALKTNEEYGTYYLDMWAFANTSILGLDATVHVNMTKGRLKKLLDKQISVIISYQAYASDPAEYDDPSIEESGHYSVFEGYDDEDYFYFMDPSLHGRRGFLSWKELKKRWHENEGSSKVEHHSRLAIVIRPNGRKPVYDQLARHID